MDISESNTFIFRARAQEIDRPEKTDTYFAYKDKSAVFVKGPFENDSGPKINLIISNIKHDFGLPYIKSSIMYLIPDIFENPLFGFRSSILKNMKYPFLVSEDKTFNNSDLQTQTIKVEYSKKHKRYFRGMSGNSIEIVDFTNINNGFPITLSHLHDINKNNVLMCEFILNILFRYLFGIPDLALQNFIKSDHIYSVDEDVVFKFDHFMNPINLDEKLCKLIKSFITINDCIIKKLQNWKLNRSFIYDLCEITGNDKKETYAILKETLLEIRNRKSLIKLFTFQKLIIFRNVYMIEKRKIFYNDDEVYFDFLTKNDIIDEQFDSDKVIVTYTERRKDFDDTSL
uniref:Uncharacterized protein n=1 Tax=viral metagenome TaxID=1070528 RepID=A0A6C0JTY6_9ZZZZ